MPTPPLNALTSTATTARLVTNINLRYLSARLCAGNASEFSLTVSAIPDTDLAASRSRRVKARRFDMERPPRLIGVQQEKHLAVQ